MHHPLLISKQVVPQSGILLQRLPDSGNVPVPENTKAASEKLMLLAVSLGELILQELYRSLCRGRANCH